MTQNNLIAIDLAKNVFQVCKVNQHNRVLSNKQVRRAQLASSIARHNPTTIVMEACYSSHYWARVFESYGHTVRLIPAQHVKPFVRGNKNDSNDALAIAEAARRPHIKFVPVKTIAQQDIQALHRIRERLVRQRTAVVNQTRGLLSEYGVICSTGIKAFLSMIVKLADSTPELVSPIIQGQILQVRQELDTLTKRINTINSELKSLASSNTDVGRVMSIPGFGFISATALVSAVGNGVQFKNAREMSVWLGVTPRHSASGDRKVEHGITKRGNRYLRKQIIHGARAALNRCKDPNDKVLIWARALAERRGVNKATVALANRLVRLAWVLLQRKEVYLAR